MRALLGCACSLALACGAHPAASPQVTEPATIPAHEVPLPPPSSSRAEEESLATGEERRYRAELGFQMLAGEDVASVRASDDGTFVVVTGVAPGDAFFEVVQEDRRVLWTVHVFEAATEQTRREVESLLRGIGGLRVRHFGPRLFVEAPEATKGEMAAIQALARARRGQVVPLVTVGAP